MSEILGPNAKRLLIHRMSLDAVPSGGGLRSAVEYLLDADRMKQSTKNSIEWVKAAIAAIKAAPDNPYGDDDETIAGEILKRIEAKK